MNKIRKLYSQAGQDLWVIHDVFKYKTKGYFVDIGAYDGIYLSNTYWLEKNLAWRGLCVEAEPNTFEKLKRNRKCACINACVGQDGKIVEFATGRGTDSGIFTKSSGAGIRVNKMTALSIDRILDDAGAPETIDYLTLDVEGMEEQVMSGFSFDKRRFLCATIERPSLGLRKLLTDSGYQLVKELPGLDTFYIHPDLSQSYTHSQKLHAAFASLPLPLRIGEVALDVWRRGLRASLRRL